MAVKRRPRAAPTMEDVAREAGVSRALVSLVFRDQPNVSAERRARVLDAAERLGYRPNAWARGLASLRTRTVGVLLNELHNPFYAEIMDGIDERASAHGLRILIGTAGSRPGGEQAALESFLELRVDGAILVGPRLPSSRIVEAARQVPIVVVARALRSPLVDSIANDERVGSQLVVRHLAALGHRRIAHIDGGSGASAGARRSGYRRAMEAAGLADEVEVVPGDYTEIAGTRGAERLLASADLPTAVFAANDLAATGAIDRLEDAGLRVPADVSVVGYDNTYLAALHHVALTTVNQPRPDMGRVAFDALVERVDGRRLAPVHLRMTPSLVVRSTTGPPRPGRARLRPSR